MLNRTIWYCTSTFLRLSRSDLAWSLRFASAATRAASGPMPRRAANVEFSRWGTVFAVDKLAAAAVDRVVHHGRLVEFGGPSHRLEHDLMLGKEGAR